MFYFKILITKKYILFFCGILLLNFLLSCSNSKETFYTLNEQHETESKSLVFTPNESFFSPVGTLTANLKDKTSGNEYNKYENYDYIYNWHVLTDTIVFGVDIKTQGDLTIQPEMGIASNQVGSKMLIYLDDVSKEITLTATGSESTYVIQKGVTFENVSVGFHLIKLKLKTLLTPNEGVGHFSNLHLSGTAVKNSTNVMRRYRAKAVHCKWGIEASDAPIEISVHELTIATKNVSFYQPITTPFGYTGSTWNKDSQTFGGYNFSLWSYGANDPAPPFYQESHLIAVGPDLEFGSYGHEGTGVKPRGPHPYIDVNRNIQIIAVRMLPGEIYDTYWSYYLDPISEHWKLYGCGKKYNKTGEIKYLTTGAFVEVPGGAHKVRSGHEICESHYRGWQMDTVGNWHTITKMIGTTAENNLSARDWKIVDSRFAMEMGGWGEVGKPKETLVLNDIGELPYYLQGDYVQELYKMPASFENQGVCEISKNTAKIKISVSNLGTNARAYLFYGVTEGLTKEAFWEKNKAFPIDLGETTVMLENLTPETKYFYRIKIINDEGITWSFNTNEFTTN